MKSLAQRFVAGTMVIAIGLCARSSAQMIVANHTVTGRPVDVSIDPFSKFAVLRMGSANGTFGNTYIVDLGQTGAPIVLTQSHPTQMLAAGPVPSDELDLLGDRIISTCFDIMQVNSPDLKVFQANPPAVLNPCTGFCPGGFATDVVVGSAPVNMTPLGITRNEYFDVELYDLTTGAAWIPSVTPVSTSGLCGWFGSAIGMSDSLKFTANRIAVLTNQMEPQTQGPMGAPPRGYLSVRVRPIQVGQLSRRDRAIRRLLVIQGGRGWQGEDWFFTSGLGGSWPSRNRAA